MMSSDGALTWLGDIAVRLRPYPVPDPQKCGPGDLIGILASRHSGHAPPQLYACEPGGGGSVYWYVANGILGSVRGPPFDDHLWSQVLIKPGGWVWLSEPAPLTWETTRDNVGRPCYVSYADGPNGPVAFWINEWSEHIGTSSERLVWTVRCGQVDLVPVEQRSLADAQRYAAGVARDIHHLAEPRLVAGGFTFDTPRGP